MILCNNYFLFIIPQALFQVREQACCLCNIVRFINLTYKCRVPCGIERLQRSIFLPKVSKSAIVNAFKREHFCSQMHCQSLPDLHSGGYESHIFVPLHNIAESCMHISFQSPQDTRSLTESIRTKLLLAVL